MQVMASAMVAFDAGFGAIRGQQGSVVKTVSKSSQGAFFGLFRDGSLPLDVKLLASSEPEWG